uniref:Uncharacterized protein n=1 Tax=Mus musculus TaxID=10090 RepID=Q8BH81_MOUSE|nr:unnamed protein product [Mus musculus]
MGFRSPHRDWGWEGEHSDLCPSMAPNAGTEPTTTGESLHRTPPTSLSTQCPAQPSPPQWKAGVGRDREEAASTVQHFQKYHFQHSYPQCWYFCLLPAHVPPRSLG